jgi:hypothetical protein
MTLPPFTAPVLIPARGSIGLPPAEILRRLTVIAYRDTKDEQRHKFRLYKAPWAVVPGTRIPVIILIYPVHTIVKEIVGINPWSIIDRIARHRGQFREQRQIDTDAQVRQPDTDAYAGWSVGDRAHQQGQRNQYVTYFLHKVLLSIK